MKNIINKSNRISTLIFSSILIFGIYFLYSLVTSTLNPNENILNATETYVADVNLDGVLNVFDIIIIINIILG